MSFKSDESGIVWSQIMFVLTLLACVGLWTVFAPVIDGLYDAKENVPLSTEPFVI